MRLLSTRACAVDGACTQRFKVVLVFGVAKWPNADWARWELAEQNYSPALNDALEQSIKLGNRIVSMRGRGNSSYAWGPSNSYAWSSSNRLVMIQFYSVAPDEFLQKYLEKYPSSI
jgi:hypothetical protein